MSDLISRKKVISILEQLEEHSLSGKMDISNAIYLLEKQPTAYDVDKVVEQLESLSNAEADYYYARSNDVIDREDAIDIVKKGGVE